MIVKSAENCVGAERLWTMPTRRETLAKVHSKPPKVNSARWREQVAHRLLDGYGVEDIALWLACRLDQVRAEVARLRSSGMLERWWS